MSSKQSFDEALDAGVDTVAAGSRFDHMLAVYPQHRAPLRPLLELATDLQRQAARARADADAAPISPRLEANYAAVRAALRRAQMEREPAESRRPRSSAPWWQRRFASLSMPAAMMFVIGVLGFTGATAATVTTIGIPDSIDGLLPGRSVTAPASHQTPGALTVTGVITDVRLRDGSFMINAGDRDWLVVLDGDTAVNATISAGATVTVAGRLEGNGGLRATSVTVSAP